MIGLYAVARNAPRAARGAQDEPLRVLSAFGLELVCGAAPPALSEEALRAHEAAVRRIADAADACLPARFGASAGQEGELLGWAEARAPELTEALRLVRGREQMTLRVLGSPAAAAAVSGGPGTRYLEERRRALSLPELEPLRSALADLIRAERVEGHAEPGRVASVYHLIDRGSAARYRGILDSTPLAGLRVTASGPWPAWSFAPELAP